MSNCVGLIKAGVIITATDNAKKNFKKGVTALLILTFLQEEDMYGYQISQTMIERSDGEFSIPEGSLYPALYKLIDDGYISDRKVQAGKRLTRIYYHLEESGREHLNQLMSDYLEVKNSIEKILNRSGENAKNDKESQ